MSPLPASAQVLVLRAGGQRYALPLSEVVETFRPLPLEPFPAAAAGVLGLARIRGVATPVVDLGTLLGGARVAATRYVVVRASDRRLALAVDAVEGVCVVELSALPPILGGAHPVSALAERDRGLMSLLDASRLLPAAEGRG